MTFCSFEAFILSFDFWTFPPEPVPSHLHPPLPFRNRSARLMWMDSEWGLKHAGGYVAAFFDEVYAKWFSPAECVQSRNGLKRLCSWHQSLMYGRLYVFCGGREFVPLSIRDGCDSSTAAQGVLLTHNKCSTCTREIARSLDKQQPQAEYSLVLKRIPHKG